MELITELNSLAEACQGGVCLCIGMFDGVHRGHQMLIEKTREEASRRGLRSLVLTFSEHPLSLLAPPYAPLLLSSPEEKARLLAQEGLDLCAMLRFTPEFAAIPARQFLREIVAGTCQARHITCGEDFHFGATGQGDIAFLRQEGQSLGIDVEVCASLYEGDSPIKSTRIRQCLLEGKVEEAALLLGRPYLLSGPVVEGDRRGRTIGFPTANVEPPPRRLVPHDGVYAVRATVMGQEHPAMMNIGLRPTFKSERRTIEVHLLDFTGDLYGREMKIRFIARIRLEKKFQSVEELIAQLNADEARCRALLSED